jgi:hypothetical protein
VTLNSTSSTNGQSGLSREQVLDLLREWLTEANVLARERGLTPAASLGLALSTIRQETRDDA